ncbi:MAG: HisA/HisF-related TIM barrel protein, partial [Syntrophomonadaceae bacterium]|nr:HisA/HisF-related TIM barrel protein [Syntrophomonadaceae bacterium]
MILLPAIDIRGGRCVRLEQGRLDRETVYADDPVATAEAFAAAGAEWLHVVDLDGAFSGSPCNLEVVRRIAAAVQVPFQLGGGLRRVDDVAEALHAGAHRVIVGTSALVEEDFIPALLERFGPERVVAGIDARDGMVAVRGWVEVSDVAATVLAARMRAMGVVRAVYTDVAQDGLLAGPNF